MFEERKRGVLVSLVANGERFIRIEKGSATNAGTEIAWMTEVVCFHAVH